MYMSSSSQGGKSLFSMHFATIFRRSVLQEEASKLVCSEQHFLSHAYQTLTAIPNLSIELKVWFRNVGCLQFKSASSQHLSGSFTHSDCALPVYGRQKSQQPQVHTSKRNSGGDSIAFTRSLVVQRLPLGFRKP